MEYYKVEKQLGNLVNDNVKKLESIFPSVVKDGEVDFETLRELLGDFKEVDKEKYEMNWVGKKEAKRIALSPLSGKTLKYVEGDGKNEDTTENIYIEGDNLEVLKLLQNSYYGKVKIIYIDPPYNTGNDFIYNDNFKIEKINLEMLEGDRNEFGERLIKNQSGSSYYHSKWLSMIYSRLLACKNLLKEDGVIFISIDEHEFSNLDIICKEIFGENNELGSIVWDKRNPKGDSKGVAYQHENILVYAKDKYAFTESNKFLRLKKNAITMLNKAEEIFKKYNTKKLPDDLLDISKKYKLNLDFEKYYEIYDLEKINKEFQAWLRKQDLSGGEKAYCYIDNNGDVYRPVSMAWPNNKKAPNDYFKPLIHPVTKKECPVPTKGWRNPPQTMQKLLDNNRILFGKDETTQPNRKYYLKENLYENIPSIIYYGGSDDDLLKSINISFDNPKPVELIKSLISSSSTNNDIILDFFSGSATTSHATMELNASDGGNRKYIMIQLPENNTENNKAFADGYKNICEIGKDRIRRAGDKIVEENKDNTQISNLDIGFKVFRVENSNIKWENRINEDNQFKYNLDGGNIDDIDFMPNTKDIDVVYEILLRHYGIPLTAKINKLDFIGDRTYTIEDSIIVCLETKITQDIIDKISELEPIKVIFRDSAFGDDISLKQNSIHRLNVLIEENNKNTTHVVEFI